MSVSELPSTFVRCLNGSFTQGRRVYAIFDVSDANRREEFCGDELGWDVCHVLLRRAPSHVDPSLLSPTLQGQEYVHMLVTTLSVSSAPLESTAAVRAEGWRFLQNALFCQEC